LDDLKELTEVYSKIERDNKSKTEKNHENKVLPSSKYIHNKRQAEYTSPEQRLYSVDYFNEHLRRNRNIERDYSILRLRDIYRDRQYEYSPKGALYDRLWDNNETRDFNLRKYHSIDNDRISFFNNPLYDTYHYDLINKYRDIYAERRPLYESYIDIRRNPYEGFSIRSTLGSNDIYEAQYPTYTESRVIMT
jgi:hypothetical protein